MRIVWRRAVPLGLIPVIAVLAIGSAQQVTAFDYVENGGFESGDASWIVSPDVDLDTVGDDVVDVREGTRSGRLVLRPGSSTFSIRQRARTGTPPGVYHLAAWVRLTSRATEVYAQVTNSVTLDTVKVPAVPQPGVWIPLAADVDVTPSSEMVVTIGGHGDPGDVIYVDGVRFEGAPPVTATPPTMSGEPPEGTATQTPTSTKTPRPTRTPSGTDTPVPESIEADLRNGGFESTGNDGSPTDWQTYGGTLSTTASDVHGGSRAGRLHSDTDSTKWLYQTVSVNGGSWYAFDAWLRDQDGGVKSASLRISWYASDDGSGRAITSADSLSSVTSPSGAYEYLSTGGVAAPSDAHSARLRILLAPNSAAPAGILVDDASFGGAEPTRDADAGTAVPGTDDAVAAANLVLGEARTPLADQPEVHGSSRPATTQATVLLNEVMYDPSGDDAAEWVELYNASGEPISLAGWSLADGASADTLPEMRIGPQEFVVVAASDSFRTGSPSYAGALLVLGGRIGDGLGNAGDRLLLRDPSGAVVDAISWGDDTSVLRPSIAAVPAGHSIERRTPGTDSDSAADWVDNMRPSPGAPFEASRAAANARPEASAATPLAASNDMSLWWLPWGLAGVSALGLLVVVSWRAAPFVSQRLRRHA
jgi:Lamin Tail Domain